MRSFSSLKKAMQIPSMAEYMFENGEMFCAWQTQELRSKFMGDLSPALQEFVLGHSHQHLRRRRGRPSSKRAGVSTVRRINIMNGYADYLQEERTKQSARSKGSPSERAFNRVAKEYKWNVSFDYAKNAMAEWRTDPKVIHLSALLRRHEK